MADLDILWLTRHWSVTAAGLSISLLSFYSTFNVTSFKVQPTDHRQRCHVQNPGLFLLTFSSERFNCVCYSSRDVVTGYYSLFYYSRISYISTDQTGPLGVNPKPLRVAPQQFFVQNCSVSLWYILTTSRYGPGNCSTCLAGKNAAFCCHALVFCHQLLTYWHRMDNFHHNSMQVQFSSQDISAVAWSCFNPWYLDAQILHWKTILNDTTWTGNTFDS